jgi:hypothetical protein
MAATEERLRKVEDQLAFVLPCVQHWAEAQAQRRQSV